MNEAWSSQPLAIHTLQYHNTHAHNFVEKLDKLRRPTLARPGDAVEDITTRTRFSTIKCNWESKHCIYYSHVKCWLSENLRDLVHGESDQDPFNHVKQVTVTATHSNVKVKCEDTTDTTFLHEVNSKLESTEKKAVATEIAQLYQITTPG